MSFLNNNQKHMQQIDKELIDVLSKTMKDSLYEIHKPNVNINKAIKSLSDKITPYIKTDKDDVCLYNKHTRIDNINTMLKKNKARAIVGLNNTVDMFGDNRLKTMIKFNKKDK